MTINKLTDLIEAKTLLSAKGDCDYERFYASENDVVFLNEFLFFIKPEITDLAGKPGFRLIMERMLDMIGFYGFTIAVMNAISADYLRKYDIIAKHYGVINALSRNAAGMMTPQAKQKFIETFGKNMKADDPALQDERVLKENFNILGSLEFLDEYVNFNPSNLELLWEKCDIVKLGPGTYCAEVHMGNEKVYLINGFHPKQLSHFTEKGKCIVTIDLKGNTEWSIARNDFIGKTNPAEAKRGSLRNDIYMNMETYGLEEVNSGANGFHLSAGPIEALAELIRYNSDYSGDMVKTPADYEFGRLLLKNFGEEKTGYFMSNPVVGYKDGRSGLFDLTEEKNSNEAADILKEVK